MMTDVVKESAVSQTFLHTQKQLSVSGMSRTPQAENQESKAAV